MMRPVLALLTLPVVATVLTACGSLSEEDLLFAAAVPRKADVEVLPAGVKSQAQERASSSQARQALEVRNCDEGELRCMAEGVSTGLNAITFGILDIVDAILKEPPTTRARGRRVWGPFFDRDKGTTFRFEMVRESNGSFSFCAHAKSGDVEERLTRDIRCDVDFDTDSQMAFILGGNFFPGELVEERARSGRGDMTLHLSRIDDNLRGIGTLLTVAFDNRDDGTEVHMVITDVPVAPGVLDDVNYDYVRSADESGEFYFDANFNIHSPDENLPLVERFQIGTEWQADQAGVGRARISGGDLAIPQASMDQCWGADGVLTYLSVDPATLEPNPNPIDDVSACVNLPFPVLTAEE